MRRFVRWLLLASLLLAPALAGAAPPADIERRLRACDACHGTDAIEIEDGYVPRIQGKPAGYLYNQLVHFRERRRTHATMNHLMQWMSDRYLAAIAAWYAGREAPYPAPAAPPANERLRERGATLVLDGDPGAEIPACQSCHGERLAGVLPNTPGLIGLPQHYISAQLGAWRVGRRSAAAPDCMATIAERLTERDIEAVAAWLASRPLPDNTAPARDPVAQPPMECGSVERPGS